MSIALANKAGKVMKKKEAGLLNLPESTLDCILERLSPLDLCNMSEVCTFLLGRCRSNGLWEKHIQLKWGRLLGDFAHREWHRHMTKIMNKDSPFLQSNPNGSFGTFSRVWPLLCLSSYLQNPTNLINLLLSNHSNMALYISLHNGWFWFPAQVYSVTPASS